MYELLVIFFAKYIVVLLGLLAFGYALWLPQGERARYVLALFGTLLLAWLLARALGLLYGHPQPFAVQGFEPLIPHPVDNSFPSDHTALMAAFAGVSWSYSRYAGLAVGALALTSGAARVLAGLHYPGDIAAGVAVGLGAAFVAYAAASRLWGRGV